MVNRHNMKKNNKNQTPKFEIYDNGTLSVSISAKNKKLGNIPAFSTLPGNEILTAGGRPLCNIVGTCGKYCEGCKAACYAVKLAKCYNNTCIPAWGRNTVILRNDPEKLKRAIKEYCSKMIVKYFRLHVSGEIESVEQLKLYCDIAKENAEVIFYIYTKVFDILAEYFLQYGALPSNLVVNLSVWHNNLDQFYCEFATSHTAEQLQSVINYFSTLGQFIYDDGTTNLAGVAHCPAVDKNGHETGVTCAQCRRCMKAGNITAVFAH